MLWIATMLFFGQSRCFFGARLSSLLLTPWSMTAVQLEQRALA